SRWEAYRLWVYRHGTQRAGTVLDPRRWWRRTSTRDRELRRALVVFARWKAVHLLRRLGYRQRPVRSLDCTSEPGRPGASERGSTGAIPEGQRHRSIPDFLSRWSLDR